MLVVVWLCDDVSSWDNVGMNLVMMMDQMTILMMMIAALDPEQKEELKMLVDPCSKFFEVSYLSLTVSKLFVTDFDHFCVIELSNLLCVCKC